jgi:hypothetical protein
MDIGKKSNKSLIMVDMESLDSLESERMKEGDVPKKISLQEVALHLTSLHALFI